MEQEKNCKNCYHYLLSKYAPNKSPCWDCVFKKDTVGHNPTDNWELNPRIEQKKDCCGQNDKTIL
jgi:hypothetical protein